MSNDENLDALHQEIQRLKKRSTELEGVRANLEKARNQLLAEKTFSDSIIQCLPGLFFMIDEQGRYKRWNKHLEKILGYTEEEMQGRDARDLVPQEDKDKIWHALMDGFRVGSFSVEYSNLSKNGREIPYYAQGITTKISGQRYAIGVEIDLTDLRNAEQALRENEEHLRSLMESATNFAVFRLKIERQDPMATQVIFVSPSAKDLLGVDKLDRLEAWFRHGHPEDVKRIIQRAYPSDPQKMLDEIIRIKGCVDGEWRWIQILATCVRDRTARHTYYNGIMFDITSRVWAEEALRVNQDRLQQQTKKLNKLNDALQVLIEHREMEIRDMETNIMETVDKLVMPFLRNLEQTQLGPDQQTYLEISLDNLQRITSPFAKKLTTWKTRLSPMEIQVADFIRLGKTSKEIAAALKVSEDTVSFHRKNIRKKLGLTHTRIHLTSFLQSLVGT